MGLWNALGRAIYQYLGFLLFPIFLNNTVRTRVLVLTEDNQVLMIKPWISNQYWNLPGGGTKNKKEEPVDAAVRELREETGLRVSAPEMILLGSQTPYRGYHATYDQHYYLVKTPPFDLKMQKLELIDARWLPLDSLPPDVHENVRTALAFMSNEGSQS